MNELQTQIEKTVAKLPHGATDEEKRNTWQELKALINSRPKEEVRRMEREMGLTR